MGDNEDKNVPGVHSVITHSGKKEPAVLCSGSEMNKCLSGIVDRMAEEARQGVTDPSSVSITGQPTTDRSDTKGGSVLQIASRETMDLCDTDRDSNGEGVSGSKQQRMSSKQSDCEDNFFTSQLHRTMNGPFVVGSQTDVIKELHDRKGIDDSPNTLSDGMGERSLSPSLCLESSAFHNQPSLEALNWPPAGISERHHLNKFVEFSPRHQKTRTDLSLADKVHLITVSETTGKSQRSLAAEFHISVGSVNNILKRKREYKEAFANGETPRSSKYKLRPSHSQHPSTVPACNELQLVLMRWLDMARMKVNPLTWPTVLEKAVQFAGKLKLNSLSSSLTWLDTLRCSMDIPVRAMTAGLRTEEDGRLLDMWRKMVPFLVQGYQPENIFSVTETTLYYKCLPDCGYVGGPVSQMASNHMLMLEHRLTVLLCCNMLGERLKPLVISRHPHPKSLRGVTVADLPVVWCHHPTASITPEIFASWLHSLEQSMSQQRRHIALFMEMTPSHLSSVLLKHVSLKFYLADSAHLLQPLNRGIVRDFKACFRRRLLQTALAHHSGVAESSKMVVRGQGAPTLSAVTELDAVFWIQDAWHTISLDTIQSSFHKAEFPHTPHSTSVSLNPVGLEPLPNNFLHLVQEAGRVFRFTPMSAHLYVEFDSLLACHSCDLDDFAGALLQDVNGQQWKGVKQEPVETNTDWGGAAEVEFCVKVEEDCVAQSVGPSQALSSLATLKRFSASNIGLLSTVFELETALLDSIGPAGHG